jgi:hypothetical protein
MRLPEKLRPPGTLRGPRARGFRRELRPPPRQYASDAERFEFGHGQSCYRDGVAATERPCLGHFAWSGRRPDSFRSYPLHD